MLAKGAVAQDSIVQASPWAKAIKHKYKGAERSQNLREAIRALPDEQRSVVVLRHVVGLTPGEIATAMGRSESSIHGLHHRGRRALQTELANRDYAPSTAALAVAA